MLQITLGDKTYQAETVSRIIELFEIDPPTTPDDGQRPFNVHDLLDEFDKEVLFAEFGDRICYLGSAEDGTGIIFDQEPKKGVDAFRAFRPEWPVPRVGFLMKMMVDMDERTIFWNEVPNLEFLKQKKIEELSKCCEDSIINGFYSNITGTPTHYGFNLVDQHNWNSLYEAVKMAITGNPMILAQLEGLGYPPGTVCIKGTGNVPWVPVTFEQYIAFWFEGMGWVAYNRQMKYYPMRTLVEQATTIEELDAITWDGGPT